MNDEDDGDYQPYSFKRITAPQRDSIRSFLYRNACTTSVTVRRQHWLVPDECAGHR